VTWYTKHLLLDDLKCNTSRTIFHIVHNEKQKGCRSHSLSSISQQLKEFFT